MLQISQKVQQPHADPKSDTVISWTNIPGVEADSQNLHKDRPSTPDAGSGPPLQISSPLTPADELAESTSSLTPAPDPSSPASVKVDKEVDQQSTLAPPEQPLSRLSTPLSELSPSPSATRDEGPDKKEEVVQAKTEETEVNVDHEAAASDGNTQSSSSHSESPKPPSSSHAAVASSPGNATSASAPAVVPSSSTSMPPPSKPLDSLLSSTTTQPSPSFPQASGPAPSSISPSTSNSKLASSSSTSEQKVMSVLELNSEILRLCMDLPSRGIPTSSPDFVSLSKKLQTNLAWMAANADKSADTNLEISLPDFEPPVVSSQFVSAEDISRVQELYQNMRKYFAKDIARQHWRRSMAASPGVNGAVIPNSNMAMNPSFKRERVESDSPDAKRRDTGENKKTPTSPALSSSSIAHSSTSVPPQSHSMSMPPPSMYPSSMDSSVTSIPSSSSVPSQMQNMDSQQQAMMAMRARQLRQSPFSHQSQHPTQQMTNVQPNGTQLQSPHTPQYPSTSAGRHMSPTSATTTSPQVAPFTPSGMTGMNPLSLNMASSSSMPVQQVSSNDSNQNAAHNRIASPMNAMNNVNGTPSSTFAAQLQAVQALGPAAVASFQVLQNPNHPFIRYMNAHVHNFMGMTLRDQLHQMEEMQIKLRTQQQLYQQQQQQQNTGMQQSNQQAQPQGMMGTTQRNQMPNGMQQAGQFRMQSGSPPNMQQVQALQQQGQQGQQRMGQMQSSPTVDGTGYNYSSNVNSGISPMQSANPALAQQTQQTMQNFYGGAGASAQQRQLVLMQQAMQRPNSSGLGVQNNASMSMGAGGPVGSNAMSAAGMNMGSGMNMNSSGMSPQYYANMVAQQNAMRMGGQLPQNSGLPGNNNGPQSNPSMNMGAPGATGQYSTLRSNPGVVPGIARSGSARSASGSDVMSPSTNNGAGPSQGAPMTPRISSSGGRQSAQQQGSDEYHRALLQAQRQAQMNVQAQMRQQQQPQMQNFNPSNMNGFPGTQPQMTGQNHLNQQGWQQSGPQDNHQQPQQQSLMNYNPGAFAGNGGARPGMNTAASSSYSGQNWGQQQFPISAPSPAGSVHQSDHAPTPSHTSPPPPSQPNANNDEFDLFTNW